MTNEELAVQIQGGNAELVPVLWEQVQRFAARLAHRVLTFSEGRGGVTIDDLMQEAFLAMLAALDGWKPEGGAFLTWYGFRLKTAFAVATGVRTRRDMLDPIHNYFPLDAPLTDGEGDTLSLVDAIADPAAEGKLHDVDEREYQAGFRYLVMETAGLTQEQCQLVELRYYQGMEFDAVAEYMRLPLSRVRYIHDRAIRELRHPRNSRRIIAYCCGDNDFTRF